MPPAGTRFGVFKRAGISTMQMAHLAAGDAASRRRVAQTVATADVFLNWRIRFQP
jgi:hypothetical protein